MKVYNSTASTYNASNITDKSTIGKDGFLKILAAQLQHQDPMNAGDNTQYIAQMAQFAALEQSQNLSLTMDKLLLSQKINEANSMIDRIVTVETDDNQFITGLVESVRAGMGVVNIVVDGSEYNVDNVIEVSNSKKGEEMFEAILEGIGSIVESIDGGSEEDVLPDN